MKKTICVTFPRSGHHLLVNILLKYFSKNVHFPTIDGRKTSIQCSNVVSANDFYYCEYYNHCKTVPCTNSLTNFQKNHDFGLKLNNNFDYNYIIQCRHPIRSIISFYSNFPKQREVSFNKDLKKKIKYWRNFVRKWVINNKNPNLLFVEYNELIENPKKKIIETLNFIDPENEIDNELLDKIFDYYVINKESNIEDFKYFDYKFFKKMEKRVLKEINSLGIKPLFN